MKPLRRQTRECVALESSESIQHANERAANLGAIQLVVETRLKLKAIASGGQES